MLGPTPSLRAAQPGARQRFRTRRPRGNPLRYVVLLVGGDCHAAQKPAPEYALLKRDEGVWNATIQLAPEPGGEAEVS